MLTASVLDAMVAGKLDDDRPPKNECLVALIDAMQEDVVRLKEMYKDRHPKNYTIADEVL